MANEPEGHKRILINVNILIIIRQVREKVKDELSVEEEQKEEQSEEMNKTELLLLAII